MVDLLDRTIQEAGELVSTRSVSVEELVTATLDRIDETEPVVHAYAYWSRETALAAARKLDAELKSGSSRGPLHGIPVGVKDLCYTADMPTEAGSRVVSGHQAGADATVVRRLREAGAVIVGKTVTHEFAYGQNVPPTRNPWDRSCYPGGSSGGSGVAVATRSAFAGIGTDTGGSIRIPASVNGVVGLKPTFGRVSRNGVVQMSPSLDHVGPLARTVTDCALVLDAIAGYDPADPTSCDVPTASNVADLDRGVDGAVIGIERDYFFEIVDPEVRAAVDAVVDDLRGQGATIVEVALPELKLFPIVALTILLGDTSAYHRRTLREQRDELDPGTRMMLELGELIPATMYATAQRGRRVLCDAMRAAFDQDALDALIAPTTPQTTVPLDDLSVGLVGNEEASMTLGMYVHQCFPANVTGQPALSVPCGFNSRELPMGFQLVGRPFREDVLFRLARAYERGQSWHTRAPELVEAV